MQGMESPVAASSKRRNTLIKYFGIIVSFLGLGMVFYVRPIVFDIKLALEHYWFLRGIAHLGGVIVSLGTGYYLWMAYCNFRYRPVKGVSDELLPRITVVVPAYNEGPLVQHTLRSLLTGDYPAEKLQVVAVNDGSQDDTWDWICAAEKEFPERITAINMAKNGGKRRALYEGIKRSTGDVLVTVDSDSIVDRDTLRNLVSPFVGDPDVGGVAGNVRVLNLDNPIGRMLDVSFVFSFEFTRSAQSYLRTVLCTPGALASYRRDLVMNVLDEWLEQKFFGKEANIGEDRALTNLMLRQGKSVLFQKNANVYTSIPETYKKLCKMFIRWGRSNARENLKMAGFAFTNFRSHHRTSARILLIMQLLWCFPSPIIFAITVWTFLMFPVQFVVSSLAGGAVWSTITAFFYFKQYRSIEALWSYVYGVFHFVALSWIIPYALLTVRQTGWLTRSLDQAVRVTTVQMPKTSSSSKIGGAIQVPAHSE